jgi:hypothetical protein
VAEPDGDDVPDHDGGHREIPDESAGNRRHRLTRYARHHGDDDKINGA